MERIDALLLLNALESLDANLTDRLDREGIAPEGFLLAGRRDWERFGLSERLRDRLAELISGRWVQEERRRCEELGVDLVSRGGAGYPECLNRSPKPPILLYARGTLPDLSRAVAVVGTRKATPYGRRVARELGRRLAERGIPLVSGGARGIDGEAHQGALEGRGRTLAVLGTGVDRIYPAEHRELFERIGSSGALVSEYPLGSDGQAWRFPRRNRIIAALAERTVVVEAPERSGALVTARDALEAGRDVWAVPGRIDEAICGGSNRLLFDGASPLVDLDVFVGYLPGQLFDPLRVPMREDGGETEGTPSPEEGKILALLQERGDRTVDNLLSECRMGAAEILDVLARLTAEGRVYSSGPGRFRASPGSSL
jgi:DNA processing protein